MDSVPWQASSKYMYTNYTTCTLHYTTCRLATLQDYFLRLFDVILRDIIAGRRVIDGAANYFGDEWWKPPVDGVRGVCTAGFSGKRVMLHGLATRPELNGQGGVARAFDQAKERWQVAVEGKGVILVREANLKLAEDACRL